MIPSNMYPNRYPYHWGSQHLPTIPYPPSSNLERFQDTPQRPIQSSTLPDESEKNIASISHMNEVDGSNEVSNADETNEVSEVEGTNEVSDDDDDERVEEPKSGMEFATEKDLLAYYKQYVKQPGFGVKTFRMKGRWECKVSDHWVCMWWHLPS
ncbi:uncharacterized protein LOC121236208 [Juglans microcarpa x Juglans regia]|uniref:uncharacterized protein LOC121236208 n=1 Tax=Juglans microcarpa x Juglans regia TaxID=2249226 RepID=UPI001B7E0A69|nr:uncharacterized protein LOC121236208 [Juglans microcarpa x Juglans regia]